MRLAKREDTGGVVLENGGLVFYISTFCERER